MGSRTWCSVHELLGREAPRLDPTERSKLHSLTGKARFYSLARWHSDLCEAGPHNSAEALVLGESLVALLAATDNRQLAQTILDAHRADVERTIRALVTVSGRPPGGGAMPAVHLSAEIGARVIPITREFLEHSALGFRAIRILTRMLYLARRQRPAWWSPGAGEELEGIWQTLSDLRTGSLRTLDPYPARSFYIEALREAARVARHHRLDWQPQIIESLEERIADPTRPVRERVYATYTLRELDPERARQAIGPHLGADRHWDYLQIITQLASSAERSALEALLLDDHRSSGVGLLEAEIIARHGAPMAGLPSTVRHGTRQLVRYALLSPDGTMRRRACETLREAGVSHEAAAVVGAVMLDAESPRWLQEISAFILGYLDEPWSTPLLETVARTITAEGPSETGAACHRTFDPSVQHAALFALGDAQHRTRTAIEIASSIVGNLSRFDAQVVHAAAYALAVLKPHVDAGGELDEGGRAQRTALMELSHEHSGNDADRTTRSLALWGLENINRSVERRRTLRKSVIWGLEPLTTEIDLTQPGGRASVVSG